MSYFTIAKFDTTHNEWSMEECHMTKAEAKEALLFNQDSAISTVKRKHWKLMTHINGKADTINADYTTLNKGA